MQQTGFGDTVAVIREATVKSIILLSDKVRPSALVRVAGIHFSSSSMNGS